MVSIQDRRELNVCAKAWRGTGEFTKKWAAFKPLHAGRSDGNIRIDGLCAMDVTVFWSLISYHHVFADSTL